MEWIHQNWQLVSFVFVHVGYILQSEVKKAMKMESYERRIEHLERMNESGLSATCQVHGEQLKHLARRLDYLEGKL